jgi:hypothetical protein
VWANVKSYWSKVTDARNKWKDKEVPTECFMRSLCELQGEDPGTGQSSDILRAAK